MVRVSQSKPGKQAARYDGLRGAKISKQRNRHKLVFEDTDQKKQKSLYFKSDPPPGYTFIPAGNPQLTEALKEFAKKSNQEIFAVTTTPHASRHELSREVHRIGWHFPTEVVARVCSYYGIRLTASGRLVEDKDDDKFFMKVYQKGQLVLDENVRDQVTINTEAKQIIKDLFPNIPDNDLFKIIKTAFQVGDGKVGTADEIPLVRRAQLSVVAHVRHTYTSYDKLLRQVPYSEARHSVESETLKKLIDWRGDDENKDAVEDTLREVVVISDEEDSDDEIEDGQILDHEDVRVQLVGSAVRQDQTNGMRPLSPELYSSSNNPTGTYRYVPQVVTRMPLQSHSELMAAQQRSRYAIWDRYRREHRAAAAPQPSHVIERVLIEDPHDRTPLFPTATRQDPRNLQNVVERPVQTINRPQSPSYIRGADGRLYERVIIPSDEPTIRSPLRRAYTPPPPPLPQFSAASSHVQYVRSRPVSPRSYPARVSSHTRNASFEGGDATIIQSIESSNDMYQSSNGRQHDYIDARKRHSDGYFIPISDSSHLDSMQRTNYGSKRQRRNDTPPSPFLQQQEEHHATFPGRSNLQQSFPRSRKVEQVMQPTLEVRNMVMDSSPQNATYGMAYDARHGFGGSSFPTTQQVVYATGPMVQPTPNQQMRPRYIEMTREEYRPIPTHANGEVRTQGFPRTSAFPSSPQTHTNYPVRYVQLDDERFQQPSVHQPELNSIKSTQPGQRVPTDVVRRVSDQYGNPQGSTYQPVARQSMMMVPQPSQQYHRNESHGHFGHSRV